jgi:hypothetical protein
MDIVDPKMADWEFTVDFGMGMFNALNLGDVTN